MVNLVSPPISKQTPVVSDALPSGISAPQPGKSRTSKRNHQSASPPKPGLPEHLRRPLASRLDDILADPHSARCMEPCTLCEKVPEDVADAALAHWDAMARLNTWPLATQQIRAALLTNGIEVSYGSLNKLLVHRRWRVLDNLVREDLKAYARQREENAVPPPTPR